MPIELRKISYQSSTYRVTSRSACENAPAQMRYESKNETIFTMITELDKDGNASLSFDEFLELMAGKEGRDEKESFSRFQN